MVGSGRPTMKSTRTPAALPEAPTAFRPVPRTGVIYVTTEAHTRLPCRRPGLVQPRPGAAGDRAALPGAPPRASEHRRRAGDQEYAPVAGLWELREAVAGLYNHLFRRGLPSKYSAENVAISRRRPRRR